MLKDKIINIIYKIANFVIQKIDRNYFICFILGSPTWVIGKPESIPCTVCGKRSNMLTLGCGEELCILCSKLSIKLLKKHYKK